MTKCITFMEKNWPKHYRKSNGFNGNCIDLEPHVMDPIGRMLYPIVPSPPKKTF